MSARAKSATRRARQQRAAVIAPPSVDVPSVGTNGLGPLARARQRLTTEEQLWGPLAVERRRKAEAGLLSAQLPEFKKVKCYKAECDAIHQMLARRSNGKECDFKQAMALLVIKLSSCKTNRQTGGDLLINPAARRWLTSPAQCGGGMPSCLCCVWRATPSLRPQQLSPWTRPRLSPCDRARVAADSVVAAFLRHSYVRTRHAVAPFRAPDGRWIG